MRNIGRRTGWAVPQVYVAQPPEAGEPPRQLRAFTKLRLGAAFDELNPWTGGIACLLGYTGAHDATTRGTVTTTLNAHYAIF